MSLALADKRHFPLRRLSLSVAVAITIAQTVAAQEPPDTNDDESRVGAYELPDPLVCFDGRTITDTTAWQEIRRPEIVAAFTEHVYGKTPTIAMHDHSLPQLGVPAQRACGQMAARDHPPPRVCRRLFSWR